MCDLNKPQILIGSSSSEIVPELIREVKYGLEEEGCLYREYAMENDQDIKFSSADLTVLVTDTVSKIYVNSEQGGLCICEIINRDLRGHRLLGINAARYLKGKPLKEKKECDQ